MFRFRMDIAGEVQLDRGIARFADGVTDYREIWPSVAEEFYADEKDQFATQGAAGGEAWAPLSPAYAGWKEIKYPGQPILQRTGDLYRSLTSKGDPNSVFVAARKALTLGSRLPYAIYHQSIAPRKVLPRRPEIQLSPEFKKTVMRQIQAYLVQVATQSGFRTGLGTLDVSKLAAKTGSGIPPRRSLESRVRRSTGGRKKANA